MSRIVDLRHERIAAACAQPIEIGGEETRAPACSQSAEIILFPLVARTWRKRPRKRLTRRFALAQTTANGPV